MIHVNGLSYQYSKQQSVLKALDLSFQPGTIYGLLGKNGTGKSTLIKNLTGLLFPTQGSCTVFDHTPSKRSLHFLKELYFVPEDYYLPNIRIQSLMAVYKDFYPRFSSAQFMGYLEHFGIPPERKTQSLSLGQKKKVLIGFALATNTRVLIMDEPTNGLDIPSKIQFRNLIKETFNKDRIVIITSHQVRDLDELIHHIIIMDDGQIILDANKEHIADKLQFHVSDQLGTYSQTIYEETLSHGVASIQKNNSGSRGYVDIEVLFNAVLHDSKTIHSHL